MQLVGADKVSNLSMVQHHDFVTESSARLARVACWGSYKVSDGTHARRHMTLSCAQTGLMAHLQEEHCVDM